MDQLAIDIHSNKLLEIREKIKLAIMDMPENERIVDLLRAGNINYFHCQEIVDILKETEADTKNIFGFYSSQRMKDWQEIVQLYRKDNVFLAESAQILQRLVQYEIPALRRSVQKSENGVKEAQKGEASCAKQAEEAQNAYRRELRKFGIGGERVRQELVGLSQGLPAVYNKLAAACTPFLPAIRYFAASQRYAGVDEAELRDLPLLRRLAEKAADMTVYEWLRQREPREVRRVQLQAEEEPQAASDAIDFGDGEIDFGAADLDFGDGIEIEVMGDETGEVQNTGDSDDGVARYDNAYSVFEYQPSFAELQANIAELLTFLHFRVVDESAPYPAHVYVASLESKPDAIEQVNVETLRSWKAGLEKLEADVNDPLTRHLTKIRSSPGYVAELAEQLDQKGRQEGKYRHLERLARDKQAGLTAAIARAHEQDELLAESARQLQAQLEDAISELYKGREVNIVGEIAALLYD